MITLDGRPLHRGLPREKAERHAKYLQEGFDKKKANDKRRTGHFEVKLDRESVQQADRLYRWAKEGGVGRCP